MGKRMILFAGPIDSLGEGFAPPFADSHAVTLVKIPRQFSDGDDVVLYTERENSLFAYLGVLKGAVLDEGERCLRFAAYAPFASPVVAFDRAHQIDRADLRAPLKGWAFSFNYIHAATFAAIEQASRNPEEAAIWRAVFGPKA